MSNERREKKNRCHKGSKTEMLDVHKASQRIQQPISISEKNRKAKAVDGWLSEVFWVGEVGCEK